MMIILILLVKQILKTVDLDFAYVVKINQKLVKLAKSLGNGKKIVTILCDDANKYYDKMFNKEYLLSKNLPYADWM